MGHLENLKGFGQEHWHFGLEHWHATLIALCLLVGSSSAGTISWAACVQNIGCVPVLVTGNGFAQSGGNLFSAATQPSQIVGAGSNVMFWFTVSVDGAAFTGGSSSCSEVFAGGSVVCVGPHCYTVDGGGCGGVVPSVVVVTNFPWITRSGSVSSVLVPVWAVGVGRDGLRHSCIVRFYRKEVSSVVIVTNSE
jgi:hypothetical protein